MQGERENIILFPKKCDFPSLATTALTCLLVDTSLSPFTLSFSATHSPTDGETQTQRGRIPELQQKKGVFSVKKASSLVCKTMCSDPLCACACICVELSFSTEVLDKV